MSITIYFFSGIYGLSKDIGISPKFYLEIHLKLFKYYLRVFHTNNFTYYKHVTFLIVQFICVPV